MPSVETKDGSFIPSVLLYCGTKGYINFNIKERGLKSTTPGKKFLRRTCSIPFLSIFIDLLYDA